MARWSLSPAIRQNRRSGARQVRAYFEKRCQNQAERFRTKLADFYGPEKAGPMRMPKPLKSASTAGARTKRSSNDCSRFSNSAASSFAGMRPTRFCGELQVRSVESWAAGERAAGGDPGWN